MCAAKTNSLTGDGGDGAVFVIHPRKNPSDALAPFGLDVDAQQLVRLRLRRLRSGGSFMGLGAIVATNGSIDTDGESPGIENGTAIFLVIIACLVFGACMGLVRAYRTKQREVFENSRYIASNRAAQARAQLEAQSQQARLQSQSQAQLQLQAQAPPIPSGGNHSSDRCSETCADSVSDMDSDIDIDEDSLENKGNA